MLKEDFFKKLKEYSLAIGKAITKEQAEFFYEKLKWCDDTAFEKSMDYLADHPGEKMTLSRLKELISYHKGIKKEDFSFNRPLKRYGEEYEIEANKLFTEAFRGEVKGEDLVERMREMEVKYPDLGWAEEAQKLEDDYEKHKTK